jgi:lipopolysaccharide transport system ATP-binding protein
MAHIVAKNLSVRLAGQKFLSTKEIVRNVSFELHEGDRLALIGPNGAGKTTLLHAIAGIQPPGSGSLDVTGTVSALFHLSVGQRREISGRRNMIIRSLLSGRGWKETQEKLPEMIEFADIGEAINDPMETYSQGMAMRVVFAAATAFSPDILLMDEWLGVGDAKFRQKSAKRMTKLVSQSGILVLATHHQRLSRQQCNLGLYLEDGEVRFFGDVNECWDAYLSTVEPEN